KIAENIASITKEATKDSHYGAYIRSFYYGNEFYMFVTETFRDVRLVGAPPSSIGKFGGDTDNWMWPRHTGDFSIFRVYANKDNKPADYSKDNVPYQPKYVIPISLKGIEQGDFTMVYGFPGRTTEYLTSYAVDMIQNVSDPAKVKIRETKLAVWDKQMKESDKVRIQYSAKYASIANYWKKWDGERNGLKKANAIEIKKSFEKEFTSKVNADANAKEKYGNLLSSYETKYKEFSLWNNQRDYFVEAMLGIEAVNYAFSFNDAVEALASGKKASDIQKNIDRLKNNTKGFFKDFDAATDEKIAAALLKMIATNLPKEQLASIFSEIEKKHKGNFEKYAQSIYAKSIFVSEEKVNKALENLEANYKKIQKDPLYLLMQSAYTKFANDVLPKYNALDIEIAKLNRTYMKAMRELVTTKKYYPDANSTLRVTYGKVDGYYPKDGVYYNHFTTLEGIMEKENPAVDEFVVHPKLKELYTNKDYGKYADKNGNMRVAFCASNHTTGGNSGSPVFNGNLELIGTNFDRNWEGTMSDIFYNPDQVRNIVLDVRYTLFVVDKFAGAGYLLDEMTIVK
ncbi:MAG: S46 family peptidase, partial [Bacteroidia bacterium]|nr:S46 family peptidase [Bacteroidia bacterium]